jgi:DNA (cytosine-5)-methyltransferase 1
MTHGSLFSGIGGFDLAAQWMGWENIFHCEMADFPNKILRYYWPKAISYGDITQTTFDVHRGHIDVLSGGFPCQPYSAAGKRNGKDDDRHLWPHMLRAIREIRPRWVVGENVFGLTTWEGGVVLEEVCTELEAEGYAVQPFIIPACAVGAPHRRDRVWIVANANLHGRNECNCNDEVNASEGRQYAQRDMEQSNGHGDASNVDISRLEGATSKRIQTDQRRGNSIQDAIFARLCKQNDWSDFPTVTPICGGDDGLPRELDGITFPKWRAESIKGYGNAIVPQVALQIFRAIEIFDTGGQHG